MKVEIRSMKEITIIILNLFETFTNHPLKNITPWSAEIFERREKIVRQQHFVM